MYTTAVAPPFGDWKKTGVKAGVKVTEPKKSPFSFKTKRKQVLVKKKTNKQKKPSKSVGDFFKHRFQDQTLQLLLHFSNKSYVVT